MEEIIKKNYNYLDDLGLNHETISVFLLKDLKGYKVVEDIYDLQPGRFIRWIYFDSKHNIQKGAIFCKIKNEMNILCKTFPNNFFHLDFNTCFVFEKMSDDERIIATALDFAKKKKKKTFT